MHSIQRPTGSKQIASLTGIELSHLPRRRFISVVSARSDTALLNNVFRRKAFH